MVSKDEGDSESESELLGEEAASSADLLLLLLFPAMVMARKRRTKAAAEKTAIPAMIRSGQIWMSKHES